MEIAVGWRWQKWLSAILVGLNLIGVTFCVPETSFKRTPNPNVIPKVMPETTTVGILNSIQSSEQGVEVREVERKSYVQQVKPWSGVNRESSLLNLFFRPLPLVLYPACMYSTLTCKCALKNFRNIEILGV